MGRMNHGGTGPGPGGRPGPGVRPGADIGRIAGRVAEHAMHHAIDNALGSRRPAPPPPPPPHYHHHHCPPPPPPPPRRLQPLAVDPVYYRHAYTALERQVYGRGATSRDWEFIDYVFGMRIQPHEYMHALQVLADYCVRYRV